MTNRVLIIQSDLAAGQMLSDFFTQRGDQVWRTANPARAKEILSHEKPTLAFIDLHLPENIWLDILSRIQQDFPLTRVIATSQSPDIRLELTESAQILGFGELKLADLEVKCEDLVKQVAAILG